VRVDMSADAGDFVREHGGKLWVWAAHPRVCCWGTQGLSGFNPVPVAGLEVWFRAPGGRLPDFLEIELRGRRHPRVEAYWDGCSYAL
jgi:hypothetical protein